MDKKSVLAASALAALALAAGCAHLGKGGATASAETGECHGVNACKGQGACGGPGHSCAGQNSCKGQGWITLTRPDCEARHGDFKKG